jgi:hypothetical protein
MDALVMLALNVARVCDGRPSPMARGFTMTFSRRALVRIDKLNARCAGKIRGVGRDKLEWALDLRLTEFVNGAHPRSDNLDIAAFRVRLEQPAGAALEFAGFNEWIRLRQGHRDQPQWQTTITTCWA